MVIIYRRSDNELIMKLIVQKPSKIAGYRAKALPLIVGIAYMATCVCFAVWLTRSIWLWLGVPFGFILCAVLLVLYMNAYDKLIIPLLRRRERRLKKRADKCGRYGDPSCER
jgi:hypothetical protein